MMQKQEEYEKMAAVERDMWWFKALHQQVYSAIRKQFSSTSIKILDAGCGTGGLISYLQEKGYNHVQGFDLSEYGLQFCRQRELDVWEGNVTHVQEYAPENSLDVIICNDVFCYLTKEERLSTITSFQKLLKKGGLLIMNNASLNAYRGKHDIAVGVGQRFSRKRILTWFKGTAFRPLQARYWPLLLAPIIFVFRSAQRVSNRNASSLETQSDVKLPALWINRLLLRITQMELKLFDTAFTGSSFFIVVKNGE
tara:strand:+ start:1704 stop:2462 length:759 start_codon:yes stop_codon:yes gene_type:complete